MSFAWKFIYNSKLWIKFSNINWKPIKTWEFFIWNTNPLRICSFLKETYLPVPQLDLCPQEILLIKVPTLFHSRQEMLPHKIAVHSLTHYKITERFCKQIRKMIGWIYQQIEVNCHMIGVLKRRKEWMRSMKNWKSILKYSVKG